MTTNETSKWADWRDDITDGLVYRSERTRAITSDREEISESEPPVDWPVSSTQKLVSSEDGQPPDTTIDPTFSHVLSSATYSPERIQRWSRVDSLADVDNLYDLGFWDNFMDVLRG